MVRLSSLGDVLFAAPAVQWLQASGRFERVGWLVEDRAASLVRDLLAFEDVIVFPRRRPSAWPRHAATLRRRRDDVVIDLQCNLKSRAQRWFLRARDQVGFAPPLAREGGERGLTRACTPPPGVRHRVATNMALLSLLGVEPPDPVPRPRLRVTGQAARQARAFTASLPGTGPLVVIHPGTSAFGRFKRWDTERFATLAQRLRKRHSARIVVTAGPGEDDLAAAVAGPLGPDAVVAPAHGIPGLAALLHEAQLLVAADSFPLHLANALGTPVVALFGPKDPSVNGPFFDRAVVVRSGVACSPCTLRSCADRLCMRRLEVEQALAAAEGLLAVASP